MKNSLRGITLVLVIALAPQLAIARQWEASYVDQFDKLKNVSERDPRAGTQPGWEHRRISEGVNRIRVELGFNEISRQTDAQLAKLAFEFPKACNPAKTGNEFLDQVTYPRPSYCGTKAGHGKKECAKLDVPSGTCIAKNSRFSSLVSIPQGECSMAATLAFLDQDSYACGEVQIGATAVYGKTESMTVGRTTDWATKELISVAPRDYKRLASFRIDATKSTHDFHLGRLSKQTASSYRIWEQSSRAQQTVKLGANEGPLVTYAFQNRTPAVLRDQLRTQGWMDHFVEACVHLPGFEIDSPWAKTGLTGIDSIKFGNLKISNFRACALVRLRFTPAPGQPGGQTLAMSMVDVSRPTFNWIYSGLDYRKEPWAVLAQVGSFFAGSILNVFVPGAGILLDIAAVTANAAISVVDLGLIPIAESIVDGHADTIVRIAWRAGLEEEVRKAVNQALEPIGTSMSIASMQLSAACDAMPSGPSWTAELRATAVAQCKNLVNGMTLDPADLLNMTGAKECFTTDYETIARPSFSTGHTPWMNEHPEYGGCRLNLTFNTPGNVGIVLPYVKCATGYVTRDLNSPPTSMQQGRDWGVSRLVTDSAFANRLTSSIASGCAPALPAANEIPGYVRLNLSRQTPVILSPIRPPAVRFPSQATGFFD